MVHNGQDGKSVVLYTLAVNDHSTAMKDRSAQKGSTAFVDCVAFGPCAVYAQKHLHQGTNTNIIGKLKTGSYINAEGRKIHTTQVVVLEQELGITIDDNLTF